MIRSSLQNLLAVFAAMAVFAIPAHANDSEAENSLGGLVLKHNDKISMDSEDLFISKNLVHVTYQYTNHSDRDVKALVAFPLPPQPDMKDDYYEDGHFSDWQGLEFQTKIDGKPVSLTKNERIEINGKEVSALLKARGLPLHWFADYEWLDKLQKMDPGKLRSWAKEGLLAEDSGGWAWLPRWRVITEISREQVFPAGRTVSVEHSYVPPVGGSAGGMLSKQSREHSPEFLQEYRDRYCVDDYFLKGIDRRERERKADYKSDYHSETWIGYILSSGANWRGPIKDFRLVVDKGTTDNLVNFCMDGVKKIGPTQFEVRKTNFTPKADLNILILQWYDDD